MFDYAALNFQQIASGGWVRNCGGATTLSYLTEIQTGPGSIEFAGERFPFVSQHWDGMLLNKRNAPAHQWVLRAVRFAVLVTIGAATWVRADHRPPDIVVFITDDLSARSLPLYGGQDIRTTAIDRLASRGLTFDAAFVASPSCAPSRAAWLTGQMPLRNGAQDNHSYPADAAPRLPRLLNRLGYQTAAFGKVAHGKSASDYDFEFIKADSSISGLRSNLAEFFEQRDDHRPLALFVGTASPHVPWPESLPELEQDITPESLHLPPTQIDTPRTRVQRSRYLSEVAELDGLLDDVLGWTDRHLSDDAIKVFTSDHGAQFPFGKWTLYDEGIRVPMIIAAPGITPPASRSDAMVSLIDVIPTLVDVVDAEHQSGLADLNLDGRSFTKVMRNPDTPHREFVFATHTGDRMMNVYPSRCVRSATHKLIYNPHPEFAFTTHIDLLRRETSGDYFNQWVQRAGIDANAKAILDRYHARPRYELYDLNADPYEQNNLYDADAVDGPQRELKRTLDRWLEASADPLAVLHEPLHLDAPETWVPRKPATRKTTSATKSRKVSK